MSYRHSQDLDETQSLLISYGYIHLLFYRFHISIWIFFNSIGLTSFSDRLTFTNAGTLNGHHTLFVCLCVFLISFWIFNLSADLTRNIGFTILHVFKSEWMDHC